jgi:uncharacterized protein YcbX
MILTELWRFPVKSMRGGRARQLAVDARGLHLDRHWMLVDHQGRFLTQRQLPHMALLNTRLDGEHLSLWADGGEPLTVACAEDGPLLDVRVWRDDCRARGVDPLVDAWLSDFLQTDCRLVYLPQEQERTVDPDYARAGEQVGFADGFPFLLISQASLDDLNARLDEPVPMQRFRPNLVVDGCEPYAEDAWKRLRIGGMVFRVVKPCSRCIIPTIDPATAQRAAEPLRTLGAYRRRDNQVWFGQNLLHEGAGLLEEGMPVEVMA